jgi:hypothetical protein
MSDTHQGKSGQSGGSKEPTKPTLEPIPDTIATPPPSRDHLKQIVFPR